jgi:pimeloyl-ACP methyl ester carboxylesterase
MSAEEPSYRAGASDPLSAGISRRRLLAVTGTLIAAAFVQTKCGGGGDGKSAATVAAETGTRQSFAENAGVRIYYEVQGSGPPLLLHHGFTGSAEGWRQYGYTDALANQFRVIAMDARGHGKSDKPHDEAAHTMELRTGDIVAVLDACDVERVHYWGYSMGGRTGFAFLQMHPERVATLINGAAASYSPKLEEKSLRQRAEGLRSGDLKAAAQALNTTEEAMALLLRDNDPEALASSSLGLLSWNGVDPSTLNAPSLHYAGELDPLLQATRRAASAMPGAVFQMIPGVNHLTGFARSDLVLPLATGFLKEHLA